MDRVWCVQMYLFPYKNPILERYFAWPKLTDRGTLIVSAVMLLTSLLDTVSPRKTSKNNLNTWQESILSVLYHPSTLIKSRHNEVPVKW